MKNGRINKVFIANRGEIARRVQRACRSLFIPSVLGVSEADRNLSFAREAEEIAVIGPGPATESYLNIDRLIRAAKERGCDAVHPGYGFLSENAEFAKRVQQSGMTFIGPDWKVIELLGSKTAARKKMIEAGVPCAPAVQEELSDQELCARAAGVGFPLLVKAAAGGGGRGMRVVREARELPNALEQARAEAKKAFGSDVVYLERFIERPRHVEVQIFGDQHGNLLHFGTRDCSVQRRHQKLVEEAPAPFLSPAVRRKVLDAGVKAGKSVGYTNAGTVEFLVKGEEFFFLEINTRIQVEHPVTERVTGIDLVALQIAVAQGEPLPISQSDVKFEGHAIEYRIYAEDPARGFQPAPGEVRVKESPTATDIREDSGIEAGDVVSSYYDALITKVIVYGESRADAISRSARYLKDYRIEGVPTTLPFHRWLLRLTPFRAVPLDTEYVQREFDSQSLETLAVAEVSDPLHRAPVNGAEAVDFFEYYSTSYEKRYLIELRHTADGLFLAKPRLLDDRTAEPKKRYCRLSNGRDTAVSSLVSEVLEVSGPEEVFGISSER